MTRWQYRVVNLGTFDAAKRLGMTLSFFGRNGWELVALYDKSSNWMENTEKGFMMFKRPVLDGEEPDGPWAEVWNSSQVVEAYRSAGA